MRSSQNIWSKRHNDGAGKRSAEVTVRGPLPERDNGVSEGKLTRIFSVIFKSATEIL
jgi:hypothetical protein